MIHYQKDTDHIVTVTLDMKGRSINIINHQSSERFAPLVKHLKEEKAKGMLRGIIITSAKKTFALGGDLDYLFQTEGTEPVFQLAEGINQIFRALESPGVPVVAAMNGSALGAGFELALACHHRIAIADSRSRFGFPEAQLGLIPGGGGITRLMWLLGVAKAYPILSDGVNYNPTQAMAMGLVDELASNRREMMEKAKAWIMKTQEGRRPWDLEGHTIPGGTSQHAQVALFLRKQVAHLAASGQSRFPAKLATLSMLYEGSMVDFDTSCRLESRHFTKLLSSQISQNMVKAFWFDLNYIKQGGNRPKGFGKFRPKKVGIIGAGRMGSGIAYVCLNYGLKVVIKDVSKPIAERGREYVARRLEAMQAEGKKQAEECEDMLSRIQTTESSSDFEDCDLVIEAVFENRMVKQKVMREAEEFTDDYSLFASNTISIPITRLAEGSLRPDNYLGLHFFSPAEEVPLVEIVRGSNTSEETVARAFDFTRFIRKIPIVVKDDWGFFAARVQNTFILEGITMLSEGYPPALIENLGRQAGMAKPALMLADDLGLNLVLRYENQAAAHYGSKYVQHPAVEVMRVMLEDLQRPGQQKRAGFYKYDGETRKGLWEGLGEVFKIKEEEISQADREELMERFLFAQVLEAVWCMQEHVIHSVAAANLGSIYGWGFPAFKGGVIQYIHDYGQEAFVSRCEAFLAKHGQRFRVPSKLEKYANTK